MIKLTFCLRRLPHLSRQEFQNYWRHTHGPLVSRHATALRIARYVQVHTFDDPVNDALQASRGGGDAYDGVAEIWWRSRADLEAAFGTEAAQEAARTLLDDERRFIDLARSALWIGHEHVVVVGE